MAAGAIAAPAVTSGGWSTPASLHVEVGTAAYQAGPFWPDAALGLQPSGLPVVYYDTGPAGSAVRAIEGQPAGGFGSPRTILSLPGGSTLQAVQADAAGETIVEYLQSHTVPRTHDVYSGV